jgi:hypothetical protein
MFPKYLQKLTFTFLFVVEKGTERTGLSFVPFFFLESSKHHWPFTVPYHGLQNRISSHITIYYSAGCH